jgi:parallel beta-helix repeat protein
MLSDRGKGMKKAIMLVLTVWMLVCSMFIGLIGFGGIGKVEAPYIPHNPIRINNNTEFASMAGLEGWTGNGLPGNPYIIEGYDINGSGYGYCIYIGNTTVYFWVKDSYLHEANGIGSDPYFPDSGIILYNVQNGNIANNTVVLNNFYGIHLYSSSNNTIANNNASNNDRGIYLLFSNNSTIVNNNITKNDIGIHIYYSYNNTIANNTAFLNKDDVIHLRFSNNNIINNNNLSLNSGIGIYLYYSSNNTLTNNTVSNNYSGIYLESSRNNTIANNTMIEDGIMVWGGQLEHWNTQTIDTSNIINGKPVYYWKNRNGGTVPLGAGEVIIANCTNILVENQDTSNGSIGIELGFSSFNTIANNTASNNDNGICLRSSSNNTITNNNASSNKYTGIFFEFSSNNTIISINTLNNEYGIYLSSSNSNIIANNNISNNRAGILLYYSSNNTITNNNVTNNNNSISLDSSNNNTITSNNASSNKYTGVYLYSSSNNTIANNNASSNTWAGIHIYSSSSNNITNNNASSNNFEGIYLESSSNNTIANNTASNNEYGIYLSSSISNIIYYNNIINNSNQAFDNTNNGNQWDNGYPLGGNYWSDYIGNDSFKGPNQDIPGSDGIGDTPYIIDADSQDNYPLMQPYKPFENYIILKQGWNLISIPFIQEEQNLTRVLGSIDSWYDAVQWYDSSNPNKPWMHNKVSKPFGNDISHLNESIGFWIHITNPGDTIFLYNGTQPTSNQTIPLHPGWNLVGYPSLTNRNRTAALNNITFGSEVDAIWTYNSANQKWEELSEDDHFEVGKGYWIHATTDCEWEVPL